MKKLLLLSLAFVLNAVDSQHVTMTRTLAPDQEKRYLELAGKGGIAYTTPQEREEFKRLSALKTLHIPLPMTQPATNSETLTKE